MEELIKATALQKQNEEMARKKLEEANTKLQTIQKQCNEAKTKHDHLQTEIKKLELRKITLNELICAKTEQETNIKTNCEQTAKELYDISWKRKIVAVKREMEESNRKYYKDLMKTFNTKVPTFVDLGEYKRKLEYKKEQENLQIKIIEMEKKIMEKRNSYAACEKSYLDAQKFQKMQLEKLKLIKKSIENVEYLIRNQEEELKKLHTTANC